MTSEQTGTLVFKDQSGAYYLLPQETLEQGRVPDEHKAQIEQLVAEQEDVQGYEIHALFTPLAVIVTGGYLIYRETRGTLGPGLHR